MLKKILINGSMITKQPTGVALHNINVLKSLIPSLESNNYEYLVYVYETSEISNFISLHLVKNISLGYLLDKFLLRFQSLHRLLWNTFLLKRLSKDFDVIYGLSTYGAFNSKKQIITVHDLISLNYPRQHLFQYLYFKFLVGHILRHSYKIIAISKFTYHEILKFYPFIKGDKIEIIYNGVDHMKDYSTPVSDSFIEDLTGGKRFYICVGCSYEHKNCLLVLETAKLMNDDSLFVLIGKKSRYFSKLKDLVKNEKIPNVLFLDYLTPSQLSSSYKLATLNIYVSKYEGFGFPPAEASYYGTESLLLETEINEEIYKQFFPNMVQNCHKSLLEKISSFKMPPVKTMHDIYTKLKAKYNWKDNSDKIEKLLGN